MLAKLMFKLWVHLVESCSDFGADMVDYWPHIENILNMFTLNHISTKILDYHYSLCNFKLLPYVFGTSIY